MDTDPSGSPAAQWRGILRSGMPGVPPDDAAWHDQLLAAYPDSAGLERYVLAAALLTFGHLSAADDVVDLMPAHPQPARILARVLTALLPMDADPYRSPDAVRRWLRTHRDHLVWVESAGRFELAGSIDGGAGSD
jgi:hypothetical protein